MPPTATMPPPPRQAHRAWDTMTVEEVQRDLAGCIERVHATQAPIVITKDGGATTVLAEFVDVDAFLEAEEIRKSVRIGEEQIVRGEVIPHEQVMREMRAKLQFRPVSK